MKKVLYSLIAAAMLVNGCHKPSSDPRVNVATGVASDTALNNVILRPVAKAFSALIGEGIEVQETTIQTTPQGFQEIQIRGYNRSYSIGQFDYLVEWLDKDGMVIPTKTNVWQRTSVQPKSPFSIRSIAPRTDAVDFRMNTRKSI